MLNQHSGTESWYLQYKQAEVDCGPTGKLMNVVDGQVREGDGSRLRGLVLSTQSFWDIVVRT